MRYSLPSRNEYATDVWNLRSNTNYLLTTDKLCQSQKCKSLNIISNFCHTELHKWRGSQRGTPVSLSVRNTRTICHYLASERRSALHAPAKMILPNLLALLLFPIMARWISLYHPTYPLHPGRKTVTLVSTSSRLHKQRHIVPQGRTKSVPFKGMFRIRRKVFPSHSFTRALL